MNKLCCELFSAKRGEVDSGQLPPCEDSLLMHAQLTNYPAAFWRCSLQCTPTCHILSWVDLSDEQLENHWNSGLPAPLAVGLPALELLFCKCVRAWKLPDCTCLANGLKCTDLCKLKRCENQKLDEEEHALDMDNSDESDAYDTE